ncbi:MAG: hypothetical protein NDI61_08605, partial [Bdellovibrionaceae bacterium]|nr:hypothetical protein [Pseudobdellovibrionaceae bacterium]
RESNDWFASLYSSYGASLAIGYKKVYLVFEGGYQSNTVDKFKSTGIMNDNIQKLNLSGGYATIGLLFDGVSTSKK